MPDKTFIKEIPVGAIALQLQADIERYEELQALCHSKGNAMGEAIYTAVAKELRAYTKRAEVWIELDKIFANMFFVMGQQYEMDRDCSLETPAPDFNACWNALMQPKDLTP